VQVVAAGVTDLRQRVILDHHRDDGFIRAVLLFRHERGRQAKVWVLHLETGSAELFRHQAARFVLRFRQFRVCREVVAEGDHLAGSLCYMTLCLAEYFFRHYHHLSHGHFSTFYHQRNLYPKIFGDG